MTDLGDAADVRSAEMAVRREERNELLTRLLADASLGGMTLDNMVRHMQHLLAEVPPV